MAALMLTYRQAQAVRASVELRPDVFVTHYPGGLSVRSDGWYVAVTQRKLSEPSLVEFYPTLEAFTEAYKS